MNCIRFFIPAAAAVCLAAQTPAPAPKPAAPPSQAPATVSAAPESPATVPPGKVVMSVGSRKITAAEYDAIVDSLPEQYRAAARGPNKAQFAESLVRLLALADEGRRLKLDQTDTYKTVMQFQGDNILANATFSEIGKTVKVDDAELRKYYEEHKAEFEEIHARHILIRAQGSPVPVRTGQKELSEPEALAKAQAIRTRIQGGEAFDKVAASESDDTGSGASGGDLGSFKHGQMVADFEKAAFALKAGELSQPVKTPFGYHIIKVESKQTRSFDDVKEGIEQQLKPQRAQAAVDDVVKKANVVLDPAFFPPAPAPSPAPAQAPPQK